MRVRAGDRFGKLVTIADAGRSADKHRLWLCRCDCGNEVTRQSNVLQTSGTPSCGCAAREVQVKHGYRGTPTYESWRSAIYRCHNKDSKDFPRYGGRGITVCQQWRDSFEDFLADMGDRPDGTTLDRYPNVDGNYEPNNCRWATGSEQARNRRRSVHVDWKGVRTHLADVAAELGITYGAAFMRLKRGKLHANY